MARKPAVAPTYAGSPRDQAEGQLHAGLLGIPPAAYEGTTLNAVQNARGQARLNTARAMQRMASAAIAMHSGKPRKR